MSYQLTAVRRLGRTRAKVAVRVQSLDEPSDDLRGVLQIGETNELVRRVHIAVWNRDYTRGRAGTGVDHSVGISTA